MPTDDDDDATIEALRALATEEGNLALVTACNEGLAPRMALTGEVAARHARLVRPDAARRGALGALTVDDPDGFIAALALAR